MLNKKIADSIYMFLIALVALIAMLAAQNCKAESVPDQSTHDWDHIGTAYAIQTFTYGLSKNAFHLQTGDAIIFSAFLTGILTFTYSYVTAQASNATALPMHDVLMNSIGQGAAVGTILMFKF
jgi:hypothetical protein